MKFIGILFLLLFSLEACQSEFTPRPSGYFRIELPEKEYRVYQDDCPYMFDYPMYALVNKDTVSVFGTPDYCWVNIVFPDFKAQIHVSYKDLQQTGYVDSLDILTEESRRLVYKHTVKADGIEEVFYQDDDARVYGMMYQISGNAASQVQFYMTDSTQHFIRGALYFNAVPNKDSLAPVVNFVTEDITHLIETLRWKNSD